MTLVTNSLGRPVKVKPVVIPKSRHVGRSYPSSVSYRDTREHYALLRKYKKDEMIKLYKNGSSLESLAKKYGVSKTTIRSWLKKWGLKRSPTLIKNNKIIEDNKYSILNDYSLGFSTAKISFRLGIGNIALVTNKLKEWGVFERDYNKRKKLCLALIGKNTPGSKGSLFDAEAKKKVISLVNDGASYNQIADVMGMYPGAVGEFVRSTGLRGRQRVHLKEFLNEQVTIDKGVVYTNYDLLKRDYESLQYALEKLASKYCISKPTITRLARRDGWRGMSDPENPMRKAYIRRVIVLYRDYKLSTLQVAERLKKRGYPWSNDETVRRYLHESGVKMRDKGEKNLLSEFYRYKHLGQREDITNKQIIDFIKDNNDKMNLKEMAAALGIDKMTIKRRADALKIDITRRPENRLDLYDKIAGEYTRGAISIRKLAEKYNVGQSTITNHFRRKKVPLKNVKKLKAQMRWASLTPSIVKDYKKGFTMQEISMRYKVGQPNVKKILLSAGVRLATRAEINIKARRARQ